MFALALAVALVAAENAPPAPAAKPAARDDRIVLGSGRHTYEWVKGWMKLPAGMTELGPTHGGIVIDAKNRVIVSTETQNSLCLFDADGKWLGAVAQELGGGLHGLCIRQEKTNQGDAEFIYAAHLSQHEAVKLALDGKVIWRIPYPQESGIYKSADDYKPTGIAVLPDGAVVVADGYGTSWLHLFDKNQKYVKSFGGPGEEAGKFNTCHGLCLDTRGEKPLLLIADRAHARLQHFDLDCKLVKVYDQELRLPCLAGIANGDGDVVVPDLKGRVTIFDKEMKLVCHLGDNPNEALRGNYNVKHDQWKDGAFMAPHGAAWDKDGNLYVEDWNELGRVTKLARVKQKS
jgi:hypothetical protein